MRALLTKEWRQLQPAAWIVAVLAFLRFVQLERDMFLAPLPWVQWNLWAFAWVVGGVVGYFQTAYEDWGGTTAYLWHRRVSVRQVLGAKAVVAWTVVLGVVLVPGVAAWGYLRWTAEFGPVLQPRRLVELAALCSSGFAAHGIATWAATLPLSRRIQPVVAGLACLGFVLVAGVPLGLDWGEPDARPAVFAAANLALALATLRLAEGRLVHGRDRVAALTAPVRWGSAVLALLLLGSLTRAALGVVAQRSRRNLLERCPPVVLDAPAGPRLASGRGWDARFLDDGTRVPDDHDRRATWHPTTLVAPGDALSWFVFGRGWHVGQSWRRVEVSMNPHRHLAWLDRTTGELHLFLDPILERWLDERAPVESEHVVAQHRFSPQTEVRTAMFPGHQLLVDPADRSLWELERAPYGLVRSSLPDGDRFVGLAPTFHRQHAVAGIRTRRGEVIAGEQGEYGWGEVGWEVIERGERDYLCEHELEDARRYDFALVDADGPAPRITFRSVDTGAVVFDHRFAPDDGAERALVAAERVARALRSPVVALVEFLRPAGGVEAVDHLLGEPELRGRRRADLLAAAWLVAAGLGALAAWRARRAGASRGEALAWAGLVLATGLGGLVAQLVLVRAWAPGSARASADADAPVLRLADG